MIKIKTAQFLWPKVYMSCLLFLWYCVCYILHNMLMITLTFFGCFGSFCYFVCCLLLLFSEPDILSPPLLLVTSRKPLWLDLQPVDIKSRWRHNWKSAQVVNSHLLCDPTIWQPGFDLPRQQWSLLNRFRTEQGHCGACRMKWRLTDTDLTQTQTQSWSLKLFLLLRPR